MFMAGPLLCAFSQVVNDYFDRDVDRINEPDRADRGQSLATRTIVLVAARAGGAGARHRVLCSARRSA